MTSLYDTWTRNHAGDFAAGVALLVRHGGSPALTLRAWDRLQALAATGGYVDAYNMGKLEGALRSIAPVAATFDPSHNGRGDVERSASPPTLMLNEKGVVVRSTSLLPLGEVPGVGSNPVKPTDRTRALHKLHSHHHALLVAAGTDEERGEHARKIMREILPALDAEYDRIRAGETSDSPADTVEWQQAPILNATDNTLHQVKRLASLRTRIARLKKHLIPAAPDKKRRDQLEAELAEKVAEKENIEKLLHEA